MSLKFLYGSSQNLESVSIVDGQIIALSDTDALLYDRNGERRPVYTLPTASASRVGGVTLSDSYSSSGGTASSGVCASSYAVNQLYSKLSSTTESASTGVCRQIHSNMSVVTTGAVVSGSSMSVPTALNTLKRYLLGRYFVCGWGLVSRTNMVKYYLCFPVYAADTDSWSLYALDVDSTGVLTNITDNSLYSVEVLTCKGIAN